MKFPFLLGFGLLLGATACGGSVEVLEGDEGVESADEAISVRSELVGGYDAQSGSIVGMALKQDGSFFYEQAVYCITFPCPPVAVSGTWTASRRYLYLKLSDGSQVRWRYSLSSKGTLTLKDKNGVEVGKLTKQATYCRTTTQCQGQSYPAVRCLGYVTCDDTTNLCGYSCGTTPCATVRCASGTCVAHPDGTASCEAVWSTGN